MSSDRNVSSSLTGAHGLLRGQRTKSYGSLVTSSLSPARQRRIQHEVQPGETLQGLSLKYGVSMEQIKRANRLYTNDSIFLKKFLYIPILTESLSFSSESELLEDVPSQKQSNLHQQVPSGNGQTDFKSPEVTSDLSPTDYLKRMDSLINQSKQAAVKTCQEGDKQFSSMEQLLYNSQDSSASSKCHQAVLGAVPLTTTKRTKTMRNKEDEIFQL
ncbi:lysM and putative peptidoglycan-binding domain-containing protein 1 [Hoplias malabaricus]|uniref:lysM and putative peptidoglycan-binding domain-containing protein 1 n=1 Tax=Hoplias malabaricus TaxID=27720 RepID=UPI00346239DB